MKLNIQAKHPLYHYLLKIYSMSSSSIQPDSARWCQNVWPSQVLFVVCRFSAWPLMSSNNIWPPPNPTEYLSLIQNIYMHNMTCLRVILLEIFCLWGFHNLTWVTTNNCWPPPKTKVFLNSMWSFHTLRVRFLKVTVSEMSGLQGFTTFLQVTAKDSTLHQKYWRSWI